MCNGRLQILGVAAAAAAAAAAPHSLEDPSAVKRILALQDLADGKSDPNGPTEGA